MKENIKLIREYVNTKYKIDCSKLIDKDVVTLAKFYLKALRLESPNFAKYEAEDLGLDI